MAVVILLIGSQSGWREWPAEEIVSRLKFRQLLRLVIYTYTLILVRTTKLKNEPGYPREP